MKFLKKLYFGFGALLCLFTFIALFFPGFDIQTKFARIELGFSTFIGFFIFVIFFKYGMPHEWHKTKINSKKNSASHLNEYDNKEDLF